MDGGGGAGRQEGQERTGRARDQRSKSLGTGGHRSGW